MRRSTTVAGLTALALAVPGAAAAAPIIPNPKKINGAFTAVSSCGTLSGIGISWTSTANVVTTIVLSSIPAACNGGSLSLTLVGSGNASLGSAGPVTVSATTQTLSSITGSPTATSVIAAYISVTGP